MGEPAITGAEQGIEKGLFGDKWHGSNFPQGQMCPIDKGQWG